MRSNIERKCNTKRSYSDEVTRNVPTKKLRGALDNQIRDYIQNNKCEKKSVEDVQNLFDNENYKSQSTPQFETGKANCTSCESNQDRRIGNIQYKYIYDIHIIINNYENSSNGLEVISDFNLDAEIAQFKEIFHDRDVALRTFIINLRDSHWVTLVVSYQNGVYVGKYVDSFYDEDGEGNETNKIPSNIKNILIKRAIKVDDLKIHQQNNSYNNGLLALENAINDVLRCSSVEEYGIFQQMQFPKDEYYFIVRRENLRRKLDENKEEKYAPEYSVNTCIQQGEYSEPEIGNGSNSTKEESFQKFYTAVQNPGPNVLYRHHTLAKMRGYFNLIGITYQLNLLMLCFYRTFVAHKYGTCSLAVEKVGVGRFDDLVLSQRNEGICIQIKHIDVERSYNSIGYLQLFPIGHRKQHRKFCINKYFNCFIKIKNTSDVKYLLIYTNADLNLTEGLQLKRPKWSSDFFPLKFDVIDLEKPEYKILKDCLCTKGTSEGHGFYQFSHEETTRKKLLHLLKEDNSRKYNAVRLQKMKNIFLDKLIFAVNQPGREELNYIIKCEIDQRCKTNIVPHVFHELQEGMLSYLTYPKGIYITKENAGMFLKQAEESDDTDTIEQDNKYSGEYKKGSGLRNCTPHLIYKLELFMYCLHRMYQRSDGISISAENENADITSNICFHYENKITYVWTKYGSGGCINFSMLFPGKDEEDGEMFSLNKYFKEYIKHVANEIWRVEHLVIYTNMGLDLTEEGKFIDIPIKFNSMDIRNHKVLMHYLCTNKSKFEHGFYQFSHDKETRSIVLNLLDSKNFSIEKVEVFKINFLEKLVFAVNQPNRKKLVCENKQQIQQYCKSDLYDVSLEYTQLHEVALQCLSAPNIYCITRKTVIQKFRDVKSNKFSARSTRVSDEKKDEFARTIVANRGLCHFRDFRKFLDSKEGWNMFDVLRRNKAERNMSCMLMPSGIGVINAFKRLYYMLFCKNGDKSELLRSLIDGGLKLSNASSILHKAGNKAPESFKELCTVLSKKLDDGKTYLEFFSGKNILENISSMLSGSGNEAAIALIALYNVLMTKLDNEETRLEFFIRMNIMKHISSMLNGAGNQAANALVALHNVLITKLEKEETLLGFIIRTNTMKHISSMLNGAGNEAANALIALYNVFIMKFGKQETLLDFIVEANIMGNISSILKGAGRSAPETLKALITLLKRKSEGRISNLELFVGKNIMTSISSMLHGARQWAPKALVALCTVLETKADGEMNYLELFLKKKIMGNISSMLSGAGKKAPEALEGLCSLIKKKFDGETTYLQFFMEERVIGNISSMIAGAGQSAPEVLEALCTILRTKLDDKMTYLKYFIEKKVMRNISSILNGAGKRAPEVLEELCAILTRKFDGEMTYLEFFVQKKVMGNISSILRSAGRFAPEALEALCIVLNTKIDGKITYLDFFIEMKLMGNISSMLHGSGRCGPEALKALYTMLSTKFDGEMTYLQFFMQKKVIGNISSMLNGAGHSAPQALEELYRILSTKLNGEMTYLDFFVAKNIMGNISRMLNGAGRGAPKALEALCTVLSTKFNCEMTYLEFFIEKQIMGNISSMLSGGGRSVPETLKELILFFDTKLNDESTYLDFYLENNILKNMSSMLRFAGNKAPEALKELHDILFNKKYLEHFTKEGLDLENLSHMLKRTRGRAPNALRKVHSLCFDTEGNRTKYFSDLISANHKGPVLFHILRDAALI